MKKTFAGTPHAKFIAAASALTWAIAMANSAGAAQLQEARVTQVVKDVKLLLEQSAPRPAAISDLVRHGTAVRTGTQSRSELTFADLTITRLGANTIFSFKEGTREMNLIDGAILFQVPKGSGGATIRTVGVTAAITGTTGIAEFHPARTSHPQLSKWLCLEGTFHLYLPNGQSVELGPGKMVTADGKSFSKVSTFDIAKLASTSLFFTGFDQPLASMNLIMLESENQLASSLLASTTNPLDPTRIVNVTSQAIVAEETPPPSLSPTVSPTVTPPPPTPSKFGTPSVISSPAPYLITNGTVITTDPSITTNGVTDYGKIYRGQTDDGAFSLWAFGSTSAFDTALRIDNTFFADPSHLPIAVFKFESLSLTGDPTIDTTNGVTKLALIGVDGITSGPPGGTLKFTGLDLLLLATVNGSINLTSDVSFQNLHELVMYARGAGSDLTINSSISNIGILGLVAEDSLHLTNPGTMSVGKLDMAAGSDLMLQIGGSLLLNGRVRLDAIVLPGASVASGVNLTLNVTGDYTNNSATESSRLTMTNRDHIAGDAGIALRATNISTANNLDVQIANQGRGRIGENALINVEASNDINIVGDATFQILNNAGSIGSDATINVSAANITANSLWVNIDNSTGGTIGGSANISLATGGDFATSVGDATFTINNIAGTITSNANLALNAGGSISTAGELSLLLGNYDESGNPAGHIRGSANVSLITGGNLTADFASIAINNRDGGRIDSSANLMLNIGGALTTLHNGTDFLGNTESLSLAVSSRYENTLGSTIGGDATLLFHSDSASIGGDMNATISDRGGTIGGNALLNFSVTHDITVQGADNMNFQGESAATWQILTGDGPDVGSPIGGTIHGNATLLLSAANLTVPAGSLEVDILNQNSGVSGPGGTIDSSANITFNVSGNLTTQTDASFAIRNNYTASGPGGIGGIGGTIGQDAVANINANSLSIGGTLDTSIHNGRNAGDNGGTIGGNATINLVVVGGIAALDDSQFIGNGGGTIGSNAAITVSAASLATTDTAPGALSASINNSGGGNIGGSASINFDLSGNLTSASDANFIIYNSSGGTIGSDATVSVGAGNITANSLLAQIDNTGGSIGASTEAGAAINMNVSGNATITNDATVAIYGSDGAASAAINFNGGSYDAGGMFLSYIDGNGTITFNNASAHADVLKAGVFGANGVLNIGGGTLSADTTLKLYAPGSNGQLNFISNVTLGGNSVKILAANSITIFDNVVVTIGGSKPADVYTGFTDEIPNANYTGFGGNKSTTGTFAGAGANDPQPLSKAPPFGTVSRATVRTGGNITTDGSGTRGKKIDSVIHVSSSDELLSLLDRAAPGPGGKITIPRSKSTSNSRNSNRTDVADRLKAGSRVNADRRAMDMRTVSSSVIRRSPQ